MKSKILLFFVATTFLASAHAQKIRLNGYANYAFDDDVDSYYSNTNYFKGTIKGGFQWGAGLEYRLNQNYGLELMYLRLDTHAPLEYYSYIGNTVKRADVDVSMNYILLGGVRSVHTSAAVEPYGGFLIGMAIIDANNPETHSDNSATKFAWGVRIGTNLWTQGKLGFKLQAQLLSIPQAVGGGLYFGTGGAGAGVTTYSSMLQFILGGGITLRLGQATK
jgi:opacity protein-like surface antigen